ncbi:MAG: NfeD family protein, partial [Bacteroidota bacterium]|nr:NfeD family protein [Bacteroidota bacterium]
MRKYIFIIMFCAFASSILMAHTVVENDTIMQDDSAKNIVYVFDINKEIAPAMWRQTQQSFEKARIENANYIILKLNTYGGMVNMADSIRTKILNSKIPVYVFIENNAASAGALISIAADKIYMRKGAKIGAAAVVNQEGKIMPEKYQSYMRSTMRATAESHGKDTIVIGNDTIFKWHRDPNIAEAMVDPRIYIENVTDTGEILTFTTKEAIVNGFCEGMAENVEDVIKQAKIENYEIKKYKPTLLDKIIGMLASPALQGILIMIIVGGIYFELQSPGIGFALGAAVLAALLYFAPLYLEGLAENWEVAVFILGLLLIAMEVFVIPGFGIAGVLGIILSITGLVLSMIDNIVFEFEYHSIEALYVVLKSFVVVSLAMFLSLVLSIWISKKVLTSSAFSSLVLDSTQKKENGFIGIDNNVRKLIGKEGIAVTMLRPSGKVQIENDIYDAKTEMGYVDKGEKIKVLRSE